MLRRKLLYNLGPMVLLLVLTAVAAIWMFQGVLRDLDRIDHQAWRVVERVNQLSIDINVIEVELYALQLGKQRHLDSLIDLVESVRGSVRQIATHHVLEDENGRAIFEGIREQLPAFERHVGALATAQDPVLAQRHNEAALSAALSLRQQTLPLSRLVRDHAHAEQQALSTWFRWLVLGLAIIFLVLINLSVIVLLRLGSMVLQPVGKLVDATKQLKNEHFDYRVQLDQKDEFDDLAQAYNSLAEQLQANERSRLETLGQAAVAMNHELNNALSIIDLQLTKLGRQTGATPALEGCLREIRQSLQRVTDTVKSLAKVRRIILTDYAPGTKMLDLQRSVEDHGPASAARS